MTIYLPEWLVWTLLLPVPLLIFVGCLALAWAWALNKVLEALRVNWWVVAYIMARQNRRRDLHYALIRAVRNQGSSKPRVSESDF